MTQTSTPFLRQIAAVYALENDTPTAELCFVFPNKRSSTFFRHYYSIEAPQASMPAVATISSFIASLSDKKQAGSLDCIFSLYREYSKLTPEVPEFDKFLFWAEMIVNDFNDVDRYLVNADALFVNLKRFKEIGSNYLTPEQIEIIRHYWGEEPSSTEADNFWKHTGPGQKGKSSGEFMKLWETLAPLYHAYHSALDRAGKVAPGMMWRKASDILQRKLAKDSLHFDRYVFVGFNVLTPAEIKIFSILRDSGHADFYWDFNSPAFEGGFNRAGKFIRANIELFPSRYTLPEGRRTTLPEIEIIGVASETAQAKLAGDILADFVRNGQIANPENAIDTAVILPDESLFPMLRRSIPYELIPNTNVTMGLPMRLTPPASLMKLIVALQSHLRRSGSEGVTFFHDDVRAIANNPSVRAIAPKEADSVIRSIEKERLFRLTPEKIAEIAPGLSVIFTAITESEPPEKVVTYIKSVIEVLAAASTGNNARFFESYAGAVDKVWQSIQTYNVPVRRSTFFRMIERTVAQRKIPLNGEPLKGLQVMGVLETRALDFDNIIMLSMNERIFPRKHYSGSFIPDTLRRGYAMATNDFQETIFAYYFYRLISRAKRVKLIYDARDIGTKSGEMSRYLTQLQHLFGGPGSSITKSMRVFPPTIFDTPPIRINKTVGIMKHLNAYCSDGYDAKFLSATALNTYIACPFMFYLRFVEGYDMDNEMKEYIDASEYGSVFHDCAHTIYTQLSQKAGGRIIPRSELTALLTSTNTTLQRIITRTVNKMHLRRQDDELDTPLSGESLVMANVMLESLKEIILADSKLDGLQFVSGEESMKLKLPLPGGYAVNFRQFIDRLDKVNGGLRIIDYKTGNEESSSSSLIKCFDSEDASRPKAIFQLLLYCYAYSLATGYNRPIKPMLYCLPKISLKGPLEIKIEKTVIEDFNCIKEQFVELLNGVITEIFNPDIPFSTATHDHACKFCNFKPLCGRSL